VTTCHKNPRYDKYITVSLPLAGIEKIIELLKVEAEAWEYTVRYRQTGMPEECLMIRDTNTTKNAQKMASFYRKLIRQFKRSLEPAGNKFLSRNTRLLRKGRTSGGGDDSREERTWIDSQGCDAEALAELTREMSVILSNEAIKLEDSRCFYRLCIDMTKDFQKLHADKDWDQVDFLSAIIRYAARVKKKLLSSPDWINTEYKWMYGTECITDLLSKE
jgi:hypothetical protein